jgi:hypothetical protein
MLGVLRREALPFVLACALALMLQLAAMPLTLAKAGDQGAGPLSVLCLGNADQSAGEAQPAPTPSHHVPGFCPCGPVCAHSGALTFAATAFAAEPALPAPSTGLKPLLPRSGASLSARPQQSSAIRAPPPART